jgi:cytoskeleton protein RodZ
VNEQTGQGFGRMLAEARESKGMTVAEVAEKLKLTPHQVEALESEDYSRLPAAVFVRGFARNYARLLNLPVDTLPGLAQPAIVASTTITAPSEQLVLRTSPVRRWLLLPLVGLLLFIVLVIALYSWLRQGEDAYLTNGVVQAPVAPLPSVQSVPVQPIPEQALTPVPVVEPVPTPVPTPVVPEKTDTPSAAVVPAVLPPTAPAKASAVEPIAHETSAASVVKHGLSLSAQEEDSWIEIVASDQNHFSKLLKAGEQWAVQGVPPLKLVIGNASHVTLTYDDKSVDLHPYISNKVAKLTLQ